MVGTGQFITFEGIEGCGKSTQATRLAGWLSAQNIATSLEKEPGYGSIGAQIRSILLSTDHHHMDPWCEALLYLADRVQHLQEFVAPRLAEGTWVLCDRFHDSSLAYQGMARGLGEDKLSAILDWAHPQTRPHLTFLFDLDPEQALARARDRNDNCPVAAKEGRFEQLEMAFHHKVRAAFQTLAAREPNRFAIISAEGSADAVFARVLSVFQDRYPHVR